MPRSDRPLQAKLRCRHPFAGGGAPGEWSGDGAYLPARE